MNTQPKPYDGVKTEQPLPDIQTLAALAAQPRFTRLANADAVRAALDLWQETQMLLDWKTNCADSSYRHYLAPLEKSKSPKVWPASFDDFLRCVVQGNDQGEQLNRFRRYLRRGIQTRSGLQTTKEDEIKLLADYQNRKYDRAIWDILAADFLRFWALEKSRGKKRAGSAGGTKTVANRAALQKI